VKRADSNARVDDLGAVQLTTLASV
jgi:hypothetical protein